MPPRDCSCARCRGEPPDDDECDDEVAPEPTYDPPDEDDLVDWETNVDCWTGVP